MMKFSSQAIALLVLPISWLLGNMPPEASAVVEGDTDPGAVAHLEQGGDVEKASASDGPATKRKSRFEGDLEELVVPLAKLQKKLNKYGCISYD